MADEGRLPSVVIRRGRVQKPRRIPRAFVDRIVADACAGAQVDMEEYAAAWLVEYPSAQPRERIRPSIPGLASPRESPRCSATVRANCPAGRRRPGTKPLGVTAGRSRRAPVGSALGCAATAIPATTGVGRAHDHMEPMSGNGMSASAPDPPPRLDELIEEMIVAAAPPFTSEQRRRLAQLLSITSVLSWPKPSAPGQAA